MVTYLLLSIMQIKEYIEEDGKSPFKKWFDDLDAVAASKITTALYRLELGNYSNVESVGLGVNAKESEGSNYGTDTRFQINNYGASKKG